MIYFGVVDGDDWVEIGIYVVEEEVSEFFKYECFFYGFDVGEFCKRV